MGLSRILQAAIGVTLSATAAFAACTGERTLQASGTLTIPDAENLARNNTAPLVCNWRTPTFGPGANCGIAHLRVEGTKIRPQYISLFRESDNVSEQGQRTYGLTPLFPGVKWHAQVNHNDNNQLGCAAGSCPTSRYSIQTTNAVKPLVCAQSVRLVIRFRR